jgi:ATP synthase F1 complex assembly factor 2
MIPLSRRCVLPSPFIRQCYSNSSSRGCIAKNKKPMILMNSNPVPTKLSPYSSITSTTTTTTNQQRNRTVPSLRSLSSSSSSSSHNRSIAGRRRFYKVVGVSKTTSPVWGDTNEFIPSKDNEERTHTADVPLWIPRCYTSTPTDPTNSTNPPPTEVVEWYTVTLDSKPLRTPAGTRLAVPSLPLAGALAIEWDSQKTVLRPVQMPLMTAVCTALDQTLPHRAQIIDQCLRFLFTDTTCYFTDPKEDRVLYQRQKKYWNSLHDYIAHSLTIPPPHTSDTTTTTTTATARPALATTATTGNSNSILFGNLPHPEELVSFCKNYLNQLDVWHLTAIHSIASETKSLLIALAALHGDFQDMNDIHHVINAGRVEEEFQIDNWGFVEGGHDYDRLNVSITIGAARTMLDMIRT